MSYRPFLIYPNVSDYKKHYYRAYCHKPIITHDGIAVRFRKKCFNHSFYESSKKDGNKDAFSYERAKRMDWIGVALMDNQCQMYVGWNSKKKKHTRNRRVTLVDNEYVIVIQFTKNGMAHFITAFVIDNPTVLHKIQRGPRW